MITVTKERSVESADKKKWRGKRDQERKQGDERKKIKTTTREI